MMQFVLRFQLLEGITHSAYNFRLNIQRVMCREYIFYRTRRYPFKGIEVRLWISERKVGKQCNSIRAAWGIRF